MEELLKNISVNDLEKLKILFSNSVVTEQRNYVTLRVFIDEYLCLVKNNHSASYYESVELSFKHLTSFFNLQKTMLSINARDIEVFFTFLNQKVKRGYSVYYRNLKAAFNKARDWGYVNENYFNKIKLPKRQKLKPAFINSNELGVICEKIKNDIVKRVVVFAFYTGMRLDEIVNLKWKNVDLINGVITVGDENFTTKGKKQRFIPMSEEARKIIENGKWRIENEQQKDIQKLSIIKFSGGASSGSTSLTTGSHGMINGFVFSKGNGDRFTGDYISKIFKKACKAAGMDSSIHFHSLRHSFASDLVQKGVPLYTIKELLGHSSIATTEIYSHLNMDALREAVKKLDTSASLSAGSRIAKEELNQHTPTPSEPTFSRGDNDVKIFRINSSSGE